MQIRVPFQYLTLTNIFLGYTAALRKKYLHPRCFFILLKQSIFFLMAPSYSAYAITTLAYHFLCVSRWVYDVSLWQQTLVYNQLKCGSVVPPCHPLLFSYSLRCHVKWHWHVACLLHCSASSRMAVLHALLYETHETSAHTDMLLRESGINPMYCRDNREYRGFKNYRWWRKPWSSTVEISWLSRAMN